MPIDPWIEANVWKEILSVRVGRTVADDHTVSWDGNHWGVPRQEVCAGLRGAQVEIERRLDGSHWLRFRGRYLRLRHCPAPLRSASPSGLRLQDSRNEKQNHCTKSNPNTTCLLITLGGNHGPGHFYFVLTGCRASCRLWPLFSVGFALGNRFAKVRMLSEISSLIGSL
jgi:hypothetical protein